jgi:hypothetical protein
MCASNASRACEARRRTGPSNSPTASETPDQATMPIGTHHHALMSASPWWAAHKLPDAYCPLMIHCTMALPARQDQRPGPCGLYLPGSCRGRYHTGRQPAALQNTAPCASRAPVRLTPRLLLGPVLRIRAHHGDHRRPRQLHPADTRDHRRVPPLHPGTAPTPVTAGSSGNGRGAFIGSPTVPAGTPAGCCS